MSFGSSDFLKNEFNKRFTRHLHSKATIDFSETLGGWFYDERACQECTREAGSNLKFNLRVRTFKSLFD